MQMLHEVPVRGLQVTVDAMAPRDEKVLKYFPSAVLAIMAP
ncbi:hypothetical protein [Variovorax sp. YR752]|nr:hypothetical protein [Variovorax sp. YR752]